MIYTLDLEFLEHGTAHGGEMKPISIALVREDGEEYYAENGMFNWAEAERYNPWLLENVRPLLLGGTHTKHPATIKQEIERILSPENDPTPEFWGYFSDYDWVLFCWHFGKMVNLPPHFPMFCRDLKQELVTREIKREVLPPQENEHLALDDARWVMNCLRFLGIVR